jgi:hypothetical protein
MARGKAVETAEIGMIEIAGIEVAVEATTGGTFLLKELGSEGIGGRETLGSGDTLDQAKSRARTVLAKRKVKVEVPFKLKDGTEGVATGIHAGNGAVMAKVIRHGRERAEQIERRQDAYKPETPQEVFDKVASLTEQSNALYDERKTLEAEWAIDQYGLDGAVRDAIREATEKAVEAEEVEAGAEVGAEVDPEPIGTVDVGGRA